MNTQLNKNGHETTENPSGKDSYGNNPGFDAENGVPTYPLGTPGRVSTRPYERRFRVTGGAEPAPKIGALVLHESWEDEEHPPGVIVARCSFNNGGYGGPANRAYYTVRWNDKLYDAPEYKLRVERVSDIAASDIVGGKAYDLKSDAFHARQAEVAKVHKELQEILDHLVVRRASRCEISQVNFMDKLRHDD
jgi:hypothetical protein